MVTVVGVDDVDVHQNLLGDVTEKKNRGDTDHAGMAAEQGERADGVGARPGEGAAVLQGEGFGQDEEPIESVDKREAAGGPEGKARVDVAEQATDGGAEDEAGSEGCVQHAKGGGAALARGDVGHVGHGGGDAGGGEAGDDASEEEPVECRGPSHDEVVEAEAEVGEKYERAAAEAVGERADDGGEEELHGGEDRAEEAEESGRAGGVAVEEAFDEAGRTGAIMPMASISRVTVKKMKVAAARRPLGGWGVRASSSLTSSGSVSNGFGASTGWGGFSVASDMVVSRGD